MNVSLECAKPRVQSFWHRAEDWRTFIRYECVCVCLSSFLMRFKMRRLILESWGTSGRVLQFQSSISRVSGGASGGVFIHADHLTLTHKHTHTLNTVCHRIHQTHSRLRLFTAQSHRDIMTWRGFSLLLKRPVNVTALDYNELTLLTQGVITSHICGVIIFVLFWGGFPTLLPSQKRPAFKIANKSLVMLYRHWILD